MAKAIATFKAAAMLCYAAIAAQAVEPFRLFRTVQGHSMTARFIGYNGNQIYIEGQDGQRFALPYESLQPDDQRYCSDAVSKKRVQQGSPSPSQSPKTPDPTPPNPTPNPEPTTDPTSPRPAPESKPSPLRQGSFFSHKFAPLGVDPKDFAKKSSGLPEANEPIDFSSHVMPILKNRCMSCHRNPYEQNGRKIKPKAGLILDSYEGVMKGTADGPSVKPRNLEESYLYELITLEEDDEDVMPPKDGKLTPEQIDVFKRWILEGALPQAAGSESSNLPTEGEPVDFEAHIFPIIKGKCINCHGEPYVKNGRTINPKANLRLDTYVNIMEGTQDGPVVTPKDLVKSNFFNLINLEADDPDIMPPKGDPLTPEQVNAVKRWILEGALPQAAATAADANAPDKPDDQDQPVLALKPSPFNDIAKRARPVGKPQIAAAEKTGAFITPLAEQHSLLRVEFASNAPSIDDSALQRFGNIRNNISHLDLSRTKVTDRGMGAIRSFYNLTWLSLRMTSVGDDSLSTLSKMPSLWYLNLVGTEVTDKGIQTLASIASLKEIYLWNSKVSEDGAAKLQAALPNAKIIFR